MSASPEPTYASADDEALQFRLLQAEAKALSKHRERLQARIDFLRNGGAVDQDGQALLESLLREERDVSARRLTLHAAIDALLWSRNVHQPWPVADA